MYRTNNTHIVFIPVKIINSRRICKDIENQLLKDIKSQLDPLKGIIIISISKFENLTTDINVSDYYMSYISK
jgi:hypothetical protein